MQITATKIPEVLVIEPKVWGDERGYFFESFNAQVFNQAVQREVNFVQDNHSMSKRGVLRGLHYQVQQPQGKLVRVVEGEVFDVAVDLRKNSPTLDNGLVNIYQRIIKSSFGFLKALRTGLWY
jgi:dTDP-4-dehydrorhamnose 3,5-epimerase